MKKYSFTGETKVVFGITLKQIKAEASFGCVVKGEVGGWIEKSENLDSSGDAWVFGDAWEITPLCIHATRFSVSVSSKTIISIGCERHTAEVWDRDGEKIGRAHGFTETQMAEYRLYIDICKKWMAIYCK